MLDFKQLTPQAMVEIRPLLDLQSFRSCDFTIGGLYIWRNFFKQEYTVYNGMLICTAEYFDKGRCYSFPVGSGDPGSALEAIKADAAERNIPLRFCCIPEEAVARLTDGIGRPYESIEYRDWADYLYPYENFLGYHGKKLTTQRNHCNRFMREYPQFEYIPLTSANMDEARAFLTVNENVFRKDNPISDEDYVRTLEVLDYFGLFGFTGGLLKVDGKTVGFTAGELIGDTLYVHIEKALSEYAGAYPMLASLYAKQMQNSGAAFINREDDSGDLGLRYSKTEYRPCAMVNKFVVEFK